ncbi:PqiC family protein [Methylophilus aquaticus]|uniref:ABC-type transport auxiliary lipoprotein family protein n=1 Tax=Methylophilus aquaticus TaxID=1971610 RepID=A0ABT9JV43_9PROT|nr:ABC-type transport auxiliary lipoprotein family protein [Methylophilus aquaticus]MDP8568379.1 ABC-type transport auxiliary lipoprotein family protein [Methylophilus aquaticus]
MMKIPDTRLRYLLLIMTCLSLSACLSINKPVKTERYSLPEVSPAVQAASATQILVLQPVVLADFLDTDRIVLQIDDISLRPTRDHLWADALSSQLDRAVISRLAKQLPNTQVMHRLANQPATAMQLHIKIDQFQGHMNGYAIASGQWQLLLPNTHKVVSRAFKFETPLNENGYPALVRALGNNIDLLASQISLAISSQ